MSDIFQEDKSNTEILVWKVEKTKKVGFALDFCPLDAVSSKGKENDKEKAEELESRQYFSASLSLQQFSPPLWFSPSFLPSFASDLLGNGQQGGQLEELPARWPGF